MSAPPARNEVVAWAVPRLWILGTALVGGLVVGGVLVPFLLFGAGRPDAGETVFALGAVLFGFGLLGWSGSIIAGQGFEELQRHLATGTDWTETDSRRAMTRIAGFGAGGMVGSSMLIAVLDLVGV